MFSTASQGNVAADADETPSTGEAMTITHAIELIRQSSRAVALTGAGVSTDAGIPDFRSPTGLWSDPRAMARLSAWGFRLFPKQFYETALTLLPSLLAARPTETHRFLVRLEQAGKLRWIITQNIDGLHQAAGSTSVIELHGTYRHCRCTRCGQSVGLAEVLARGNPKDLPPRCRCGGILKPDLVLFGDPLPEEVFARALQVVGQCDLLMVLGSSLVVYPAADLPRRAQEAGAKIIIVNREATPYDDIADVVLHIELGEFCAALAAQWDLIAGE